MGRTVVTLATEWPGHEGGRRKRRQRWLDLIEFPQKFAYANQETAPHRKLYISSDWSAHFRPGRRLAGRCQVRKAFYQGPRLPTQDISVKPLCTVVCSLL